METRNMIGKGKAYANRKKKKDRPLNDLYHTPFSLVWELLKYERFYSCLEPAYGLGAIVKAALTKGTGFRAYSDINPLESGVTKLDFLNITLWNGDILTNFPFSNWDNLVLHAKKISTGKVCVIGKTNYFGCKGRLASGIWSDLSKVYIFNRYVDYQTPFRTDGLFHVGTICSGWFLWEKNTLRPPEIHFINIDKYAKLGAYKK